MSTLDDERAMQPFMDQFYKRKGYETIDRSRSCRQFDCIISNSNRTCRVEEKFLFTREYDQMLVELLQDAVKPDIGWFYHVECEYLVWAYCNEDRVSQPKKIYMVAWERFKKFVLKYLSDTNWTRVNICTKNYGVTINLPVSWESLITENIAVPYPWEAPTIIATIEPEQLRMDL